MTGREALYVVRLDSTRAEVVVGPRDSLRVRTIMLKDVNWIGDVPVDGGGGVRENLHVRVRSSQEPLSARLSLEGRTGVVVLDDGEFGVAPGQACVFYSSEPNARVLGGGWIAATSADVEEAVSGVAARAEKFRSATPVPVVAGSAE